MCLATSTFGNIFGNLHPEKNCIFGCFFERNPLPGSDSARHLEPDAAILARFGARRGQISHKTNFSEKLGATFSTKMRGCCGKPPFFLLGLCYFPIFWSPWNPLGPIWARFWKLLALCWRHFARRPPKSKYSQSHRETALATDLAVRAGLETSSSVHDDGV